MAENRKTVMFFLNSLHRGGAERVFVQLAERFADKGCRSIVVTSYPAPDRVEYPLSERVEHYNLEPELIAQSRLKRNVSRIRKLRRLIRSLRPDVIFSCMQENNFRAMLAGAGLPVRNIVTVCSAAEVEYGGLMGHMVGKLLMPAAAGCVLQTEDERAWFPKRLQKKARIIMNQVSPAFFEARHSGERHDIVTFGRLTEAKNQLLLIRAYARIAAETEEKLLIYGTGELRGTLQAEIDRLHLEERVKLMGVSGDVANDVKDARMFVLSSSWEGLPNALLESMALGLPCVATDCLGGGPAAVIRDGVNGLLVPARDEKALAEAMLRLLRDPELAERLGVAARESAESFRPDAVFAEWDRYAEDVLHG